MPKKRSDAAFFSKLSVFARSLIREAGAARHRRALVLAGEAIWTLHAARACLRETPYTDILWLSTRAPEGSRSIEASKAHKVLGSEVDVLVFDAHSGFDPDAFGAVVGCVRGGGLLLLLTPPLCEWPGRSDPENERLAVFPHHAEDIGGRYLRRLVSVLRDDEDVALVEQRREICEPKSIGHAAVSSEAAPAESYPTADQQRAVEAIVRVAEGHRRRPLVLTSDRGRGKSSALGIAAAQLLRSRPRTIVVTAPRIDSVEPLFEHARRLLPDAIVRRGYLHHGEAVIRFIAPDALSLSPPQADLVLVDEAAAIPSPLLERLLLQNARIVFATTIHGYEGAGRGFAVRFQQVLERITPGWRSLRMETPVRWAPHDPAERLSFDMLLLHASPAPDEAMMRIQTGDCVFEHLDRNALSKDKHTLSELFGLLVLAHYQTRPTDLRHLLDGPNLNIYIMRRHGHVVATALVADEGGLQTPLCREIYLGRRRVRGHLLPQTLAAHLGLEKAPELLGLRIIRIAVHPAVQGRGLGSSLLEHIVTLAQERDYIGACFGASVGLLRFWKNAGFHAVRLGITRGATSGTHSAVVLHPLTRDGQELCDSARARFHTHLPHLLSDPLRELEPGLAFALLQAQGASSPTAEVDEHDWQGIATFAFAQRGYESSMPSIWKLVTASMADPSTATSLNRLHREVLIGKVLQKRSWRETARILKLSGRAAVVEALRSALRQLLLQFGTPYARREAESMVEP